MDVSARQVSFKLGHFRFEVGIVLEDLPDIQQRDPLRLNRRRRFRIVSLCR